MKEVRMDWLTYKRELNAEFESGVAEGKEEQLNELLEFIESRQSFEKYFNREPDGVWIKLLSAIGRDNELIQEQDNE